MGVTISAQLLKDVGRRDEAIQEYRHAVAIKPCFGPAWLGLGRVLEEMGRKTEAEDCYRKAMMKENLIQLAPELELLARFCLSRGWDDVAAKNYEAVIKSSPSDGALYLEAGQNFQTLGPNAQAKQCYADSAKLVPDSIRAHFLYGVELGRDDRLADAAAQFCEAIRIRPDMPEARINFGIALSKEGIYPEALEQFDKVLAQSTNNAIVLNMQKLSDTTFRSTTSTCHRQPLISEER